MALGKFLDKTDRIKDKAAELTDQIKDKAEEIEEKAGQLQATAAETVSRALGEFNEAIPVLKALGFSVRDFRAGMGVIPEIQARLTASVSAVDAGRIEELIRKNEDNKSLTAILKALVTASHLKDQLAELAFTGVEVDLKLGLPPKVSVSFM